MSFEWVGGLGLGLLGSLHCAGMCGPLMVLMGQGGLRDRGWKTRLACYHAGRITTYAMLGLALGALGKGFVLAGLQQALSLLLGSAILMSTLLTTTLRPPEALLKTLLRLRASALRRWKTPTATSQWTLGALNGLLPCGLVYVACGVAAAEGSLLHGLAFMTTFGLGTLPMLLGVRWVGRRLTPRMSQRFQQAIPIVMGLVGTLLVLRGLGLGIPYVSPDLALKHPCHV